MTADDPSHKELYGARLIFFAADIRCAWCGKEQYVGCCFAPDNKCVAHLRLLAERRLFITGKGVARMSLKRLIIVAVSAVGLSLTGYSASAGPVQDAGGAATQMVNSKSTFTLIRGGRGGGGGGGFRGGAGGGGFRSFSSGRSSFQSGPSLRSGSLRFAPRISGIGGRRAYGALRGGRRGYWRGGRWYWYGGGYYGGSCYSNCLAAGYGPAYCSTYAYDYCY